MDSKADQFEGVNVGDTVRVSYEFEVTRRAPDGRVYGKRISFGSSPVDVRTVEVVKRALPTKPGLYVSRWGLENYEENADLYVRDPDGEWNSDRSGEWLYVSKSIPEDLVRLVPEVSA